MIYFKIDFEKEKGLVPAIIQDYKTNDVFMLGYMNEEALQKTLQSGWVYFWSRSRQELWMKGGKSGNKLKLREIVTDCDRDALLLKVELIGTNVCHKGFRSCFYKNCHDY